MNRDQKGSVPLRYWTMWWITIFVADFIFYILLTPIWSLYEAGRIYLARYGVRIGQQIQRPCRVHRHPVVARDDEEAITFTLIHQGRLSPLT